MSESRDAMVAAMKRTAVPILRELGFKGTFPQFRRVAGTRIDLLAFQFSQWGGQFVVEIGSFSSTGHVMAGTGELIPPAEVRLKHLPRHLRLGSTPDHRDHWFNFDGGDYDEVAASVLPYISGQAVEWWARS